MVIVYILRSDILVGPDNTVCIRLDICQTIPGEMSQYDHNNGVRCGVQCNASDLEGVSEPRCLDDDDQQRYYCH